MKKLLFHLFLGIAAFAVATQTIAQSELSERWKRQNDRGNRYEGLIDVPVSLTDIELVSFLGFREEAYENVDAWVRFFLPDATDALIRAGELQVEEQYLMEAKPDAWRGWSNWGPWPLTDVLDRYQVPPENLGLVVQLDNHGRRFAPAFVYHSSLPETVDRYTLVFRPGKPLKQVAYTLYRSQTELLGGTVSGPEYAGEPVSIELDVSKISEAGPLRVELRGAFRNGNGGELVEDFEFFHRPRMDRFD